MSPLLPSTEAALLRSLAQIQAETRQPSMVAGLVRDGVLAWTDYRGQTSGPDMQYRIGSITKSVTAIAGEIGRVEAGDWSVEESPLRNAPHTARALAGEWNRPYDRTVGAFPTGVYTDKYFPAVARIDQAYGDRNLACACPPIDAFA